MSTWPIDDLERQAVEERRELHERANELKTRVLIARQNLDINRNAQRHFVGAAAVLAGVGLLFGYVFAGMFTER